MINKELNKSYILIPFLILSESHHFRIKNNQYH